MLFRSSLLTQNSSLLTASKKKKILVVDVDGTIAREVKGEMAGPMPGAKEALSKLKDAGYEIVIYTCRMTIDGDMTAKKAKREKEKIEKWFEENEIPYDRIDDGTKGKPIATFSIDNRNIEYHGGNDWERICSFILSKG